MTAFYLPSHETNFLTANMDTVLGMIGTENIVSFELYFGVFIIQMSDGMNSFELDLIGSNISITGEPGSYVLSGTVTTAYLRMPGTALNNRSVEISGFSTSLADLFADAKALYSDSDYVAGGFGASALYGYGGDDNLGGGPNGPGGAVQDTLYGGAGNDRFGITEVGDQADYNPAIYGGTGRDSVLIDWTNRESSAVLNSSRFTNVPESIEVIEFSYDYYNYPEGYTYLNAKITALPGAGLLAATGLEEIIDLQEITATGAGLIDLSGVAINDSNDAPISGDEVFRYFGTEGDDGFLAPESFGTATNIAYYGYGGNDTLGASASAIETLVGGAGNDVYLLAPSSFTFGARDVIAEDVEGGSDTVFSTSSTSLEDFANVEHLTLLGSDDINGTGNTGSNRITGNAGDNILHGGFGGLDTLRGGAGDDTYYQTSGVTIVEAANAGIDTLISALTTSLSASVDVLRLTGSAAINGTGNSIANRITGNSGANVLNGGAGDDTLQGLAGADTLIGGTGNDTFYLTATSTVIEAAGAGTDTGLSATNAILATNVENLVLTGSAAINGTGNSLGNSISGNAGANRLTGAGGDDTLGGGAGADTLIGDAGNDRLTGGASKDLLTGGAGNDVFDFNLTSESATGTTSADVISDFTRGRDKIDLASIDAFQGGSNNAFVFNGTAAFSSATKGEVRFKTFDLAGTTDDYTMVYIDTDGDTSVEMAIRLTGLYALTATDFVL